MSELYIGTSGWAYSHWEGIFYPRNLKAKDKLKYFSKHFKTVEVNYSFYRLPKATTYQKWYSQTPGNFLFSVKASRFITHIKRLKGIKEAWKQFLENALNLKEKLGPILFQFPPSFRATKENLERLEEFFKIVTPRSKVSLAFEFRHKSWCDEHIYKILKKYNIVWVITDSSCYPRTDEVTADFIYIRLHGPTAMFSSKYTKEDLKTLSQKIKKWLTANKDVFVYFNNDFHGFAVENAKTLQKLLNSD